MITSTGTIMNSTWGHSITSSQYIIDSSNPNLQFTGNTAWGSYNHYVLAPNGCYYGIPGTARCPIKIDPKTSISGSNTNFQSSTFTLITKSSVTGNDYFLPDYRDLSPLSTSLAIQKYGYGVLAHDGKIYAMPYWNARPSAGASLPQRTYFDATRNNILVIDPNTDTYTTCSFLSTSPGSLPNLSTSQLFWSCVLGSDGYIYSSYNTTPSTTTVNRIVRFNPLTLTPTGNILQLTNQINQQGSFAAFSSGSYVYFLPQLITFGNVSKPPSLIRLNVNQFSNGTSNGVELVPFISPFSASSGTSPWGNTITFGGTIPLSSSLVVFTPRYLSSTSPLSQSLAYNPQTNTFSVLTHSLITDNSYFGGGRNINGNGYLISGTETLPMFNLIESGSGYSASVDLNFPLKNIDKYISTIFGVNNNPSPSSTYKHIITQNNTFTDDIKYTTSIAEFISVKGYYNGITGFSPKDNGYLIPTNTSSLTSSLYNFYYNHF
jgi:hypothetical protein